MKKSQQLYYWYIVAGGALGMMAAFLQTLEKLALIQNKDAILPCNINSVFNCSTVLSAWQSSVFGFPNSIMCLVLFTIFTIGGLAGALGSTLSRTFQATIQALSLFTLGFAMWFLWQSTYVIGALCIFCLFCFAGLLIVNWGWLRITVHHLPLSKKAQKYLIRACAQGLDTFAWVLLAAIVAFAMFIQFGL